MGALLRLSAAACIYVALNEQVEGRVLGHKRQGKTLHKKHFYKPRNFKALKHIKIKLHYLIQSIHLTQEKKKGQENGHLHKIKLNMYIKKLEMIMNYS